MSGDWRELLYRTLDGEQLSEAEAESLRESLGQEENGREAVEWFQFEATISGHLQPKDAETIARSRERLLAKAILREKHRAMSRHTSVRRVATPKLVGMTVAAALLVAAVVGWLVMPRRYHEPRADGDFHLLAVEAGQELPAPVQRGSRLVSGANGASVALGGYCDVALEPDAEITVLGEPGKEAVELHRGEVHARVRPTRGEFTLVTPLGPVEVSGTEFTTTVKYPDLLKGENAMSSRTTRVLVTVAVLSGAVVCHLSDSPTVLRQGANQAFAGEQDGTKGVVASTTDLSVTLKADSEEPITFHASKEKKLTIREVSQLFPGDEVTIAWNEGEGKKWIQDISGQGTVEGIVAGRSRSWIEVAPEGKKAQRFSPPWRGGSPAQGGGFDQEVLKKIAAAKVGDSVVLTWEMPEGKRVVDVVIRKRAQRTPERETSDAGGLPAGINGFKGLLVGKITEKNDDHNTFVLEVQKVGKVWRGSRVENADGVIGKSLPFDFRAESRQANQHRETLRSLKAGDVVQVGASHIKDGRLTVVEMFRKVE